MVVVLVVIVEFCTPAIYSLGQRYEMFFIGMVTLLWASYIFAYILLPLCTLIVVFGQKGGPSCNRLNFTRT